MDPQLWSEVGAGLGDLAAGEGVMGLRRAFAVAGARTLILSLWKVPDLQTRMLMTYFYQALIEGRGRAESLRAAQRRVRAAHPEPFYWAAFICQGDPTPLPDVTRGETDRTGARTPARKRGAR